VAKVHTPSGLPAWHASINPIAAGLAAGATRSNTKWREVDYEWLGAHPDEVATSLFKQGQNQPNAIPHKLSEVRGGGQCADQPLQPYPLP
jgi:hypothetical protein